MSGGQETPSRGWIEVRAVSARTGPAFAVYDLTERRDRAQLLYLTPDRRAALEWALRWSVLTGRRFGLPGSFSRRQRAAQAACGGAAWRVRHTSDASAAVL